MGIFSWIVFGLIAGAFAKLLMPGRDPGGIVLTILLGVVGAILGGFIGTMMGYGTVTRFDFSSLIIAIGGAMLVLIVYRVVAPRLMT